MAVFSPCRLFPANLTTNLRPAMLAAVTACSLTVAPAMAQWTVVNLHPTGTSSRANGSGGNQQVGTVNLAGSQRASLWIGGAGSWVNLNPTGSSESVAFATSGAQQVGWVRNSTTFAITASLWSGSAGSRIDLNPAGAGGSQALGIGGGRQAGFVFVGSSNRRSASTWTGTAASWVNLNPSQSTESIAYATSDANQAGYVTIAGVARASLWSGSAASWVDLHPNTATESIALGLSGGQQVGYATIGGEWRASLWNGTASSWVDLSPAGALGSRALGTNGRQQVGFANVGGRSRASLWNQTASSWTDLSQFLPTTFISSVATSITTDGINTYISGHGFNNATGREEAVVWVQPIPSPSAAALVGLGGLLAARRRRR